MNLTGKQKRFLRAEAHHLSAIVTVGKEGMGESVLSAVRAALEDHELIKVKVLEAAPIERSEAAVALASGAGAVLVGQVGRIVILYRRHPERPAIRLPGA